MHLYVWTKKTLGQKTNTILISMRCGSASRAHNAASRDSLNLFSEKALGLPWIARLA
jgi:hypothetical protein